MKLMYLNYRSDYDGQYRIGVERLEDASIPILVNPLTGEFTYKNKVVLKEMKETGVGYYTTVLKPDEKLYTSPRNMTEEPLFKVPMECQ